MNGVSIRPATPMEHEPAVRLLADAFAHDPLIRAAVGNASAPDAARRAVFRTSLEVTLDQGGALLVAEAASALHVGVAHDNPLLAPRSFSTPRPM